MEYQKHKEAECSRGYHISLSSKWTMGLLRPPLPLNGLLKNFWTGEFFLKVSKSFWLMVLMIQDKFWAWPKKAVFDSFWAPLHGLLKIFWTGEFFLKVDFLILWMLVIIVREFQIWPKKAVFDSFWAPFQRLWRKFGRAEFFKKWLF